MNQLPKLNTEPRYETTLPDSGEKIKYRPFLVKEEKLILQAIYSQDSAQMINAVINVAENCTGGQIDLSKLSILDIEHLWLQMRIKSKGEISEVVYKCKNKLDNGETCNHTNHIEIDLTEIKGSGNTKTNSNVVIVDKYRNIGVKLKKPSLDMSSAYSDLDLDNPATNFDIIKDLIEVIFEQEEVFNPKDFSDEQLLEFTDGLSNKNYLDIAKYYKEIPRIRHKIEFQCDKCKFNHTVNLEGLESFLG